MEAEDDEDENGIKDDDSGENDEENIIMRGTICASVFMTLGLGHESKCCRDPLLQVPKQPILKGLATLDYPHF